MQPFERDIVKKSSCAIVAVVYEYGDVKILQLGENLLSVELRLVRGEVGNYDNYSDFRILQNLLLGILQFVLVFAN